MELFVLYFLGYSQLHSGQVLGTAGYMSPEQAEGKTRLVAEFSQSS